MENDMQGKNRDGEKQAEGQQHTPRDLEQMFENLTKLPAIMDAANITLGFGVWVRSTGIILAVTLGMVLLGAGAILAEIPLIVSIAIQVMLLQWALTTEGRSRYRLTPLPSGWWSVTWRVALYILPMFIVLMLLLIPQDYLRDSERMMQGDVLPEAVALRMLIIQLITSVLSIIPTGIASHQAFLIALRRRRMLGEMEIRIRRRQETDEKDSDKSSGS